MMSGEQLRQWVVYARDNAVDAVRYHAAHSPYYLGWSVRGYRRLCVKWWQAYIDDHRQQIATARQMLREAKDLPRGDARAAAESKARALREVRRAEFTPHTTRRWIRPGISGIVIAGGGTIAAAVGGLWVRILIAIAVIVTGAWFGRPEEPEVAAVQAPTRPSHWVKDDMRRGTSEAEAVPEKRAVEIRGVGILHQDGPDIAYAVNFPSGTSHMGEDVMRRVLVEAGAVPEKRAGEIRGVGIPHQDGPGIAYAVDLPSGIPASIALAKAEQIASALAVHQDWMDLELDRSA